MVKELRVIAIAKWSFGFKNAFLIFQKPPIRNYHKSIIMGNYTIVWTYCCIHYLWPGPILITPNPKLHISHHDHSLQPWVDSSRSTLHAHWLSLTRCFGILKSWRTWSSSWINNCISSDMIFLIFLMIYIYKHFWQLSIIKTKKKTTTTTTTTTCTWIF